MRHMYTNVSAHMSYKIQVCNIYHFQCVNNLVYINVTAITFNRLICYNRIQNMVACNVMEYIYWLKPYRACFTFNLYLNYAES